MGGCLRPHNASSVCDKHSIPEGGEHGKMVRRYMRTQAPLGRVSEWGEGDGKGRTGHAVEGLWLDVGLLDGLVLILLHLLEQWGRGRKEWIRTPANSRQ